jgi:uncharacterized protein YggT (Ycf19 family)
MILPDFTDWFTYLVDRFILFGSIGMLLFLLVILVLLNWMRPDEKSKNWRG